MILAKFMRSWYTNECKTINMQTWDGQLNHTWAWIYEPSKIPFSMDTTSYNVSLSFSYKNLWYLHIWSSRCLEQDRPPDKMCNHSEPKIIIPIYKMVLLITRMNKIKNISILCYVKGVLKVIEQWPCPSMLLLHSHAGPTWALGKIAILA